VTASLDSPTINLNRKGLGTNQNEGNGYVSASIIPESNNMKSRDEKFLSDTFQSKLPTKKEMSIERANDEYNDFYKSIPIQENQGSMMDSYDGGNRDTSESPSRQKGFIVRVFDGDLSQTKEEAYDKHCKR
jgi:hypothetical protein